MAVAGCDVYTSQRPPPAALLSAAAALEAACFPERGEVQPGELSRALALRRAALLVRSAEDGAAVLGFTLLSWNSIGGTLSKARCYLLCGAHNHAPDVPTVQLCVSPRHRRRGHGAALLSASMDTLRAAGVRHVTLHVDAGADGAPARELYLRGGFTEDGPVADYYGAGRAALRMTSQLAWMNDTSH